MGIEDYEIILATRDDVPGILASKSATCAVTAGRFRLRFPASGSRRQLPICRLS